MFKRFFFALAASLCLSAPAFAHSVRELQLDEIIDAAAVAFEGTVVDTHSETDAQSGRIVTLTTFEVTDVLKGNVGARHTIKQLGGQVGDRFYKVTLQQKYALGQSVVVFLYGKSQLGFSAPVGIAQGNFNIVQDAEGVGVSNGRDVDQITRRMAGKPSFARIISEARGSNPQKMGLEQFKQLVRSHIGGGQ